MNAVKLHISPPGTRFIAGFVNREAKVESEVYQNSEGLFCVILRDSDSGEILPTITQFSDEITAKYKAREIIGLKPILVTESHGGYAHTRLSGICGPDVTVTDIEREMYHPYFGGREARISGGEWSCVRHDD